MKEIKQSKACQYLYAVIKEADWIDDEYKQFAEKFKKTEEPLRELYLCICDKVSLDMLQLAELSEPIEEAFRECRQRHIESAFMKKYSKDIRKIKHIATATEKEVKNMSGTVKQLAENIPTFEEMFMHPTEIKDTNVAQENLEVKKEVIRIKTNEIPESAEKTKEAYSIASQSKAGNAFKRFLDKQNSIFSMYHRKRPGKYIEALVKEGYSVEQIDFILDCIEAGDSIRDIEAFASPKISVELMRKLRNIGRES